MSTTYYKTVRKHLSSNCPVMKALIARVGPCILAPKGDDPFTLLVRCVIGQQISTKAAASIFDKLAKAVTGPPDPQPRPTARRWPCGSARRPFRPRLAKFTEADYKACGISAPKQRTLRAVIEHVQANPDLLPGIPEWSDDDIRDRLTVVKGIGPWTVDMFLLFGLGRPDVWPVGDFGVKMAVKALFNMRKVPDAARLTKVAKVWQPYRSVASWYLWRSLDPEHRDAEP